MEATKLLKSQHAEVRALFKKFEKTRGSAGKAKVSLEIFDSLAAHCTIEEKIFYPSSFKGDLKDMLLEAAEEHLGAKRIIADLLGMTPDDENYAAKMTVLKESIEHHVEEEESDLFPKVRKKTSKTKLEAMGDAMKVMFDGLMAKAPSKNVPSETASAADIG